MNKSDLIAAVAAATGISKSDTAGVVDVTFEVISDALRRNDDVRLTGFGTFNVADRAARDGRNPRTGEAVEVTHQNLNDGTVEGLAHAEKPLFSVQYHPEASPGPHDARYFFARFRELVLRNRNGEALSGLAVAQGR